VGSLILTAAHCQRQEKAATHAGAKVLKVIEISTKTEKYPTQRPKLALTLLTQHEIA